MPVIPIHGPAAEPAQKIAELVTSHGGSAYIVGGWVRDALLNPKQQNTDLDIEVFGIQPDELHNILRTNFRCDLYGKAFQIIGLRDHNIDIAIPRRERKTGVKHTDFEVEGDPDMTVEQAAARRDFTVNAIYAKLPEGLIEDPFAGVLDLRAGILRHTTERFKEDPLRVLRAMQFSARLGFDVHPETIQLCRSLSHRDLTQERVFQEWKKLLLRGMDFHRGLGFLRDCGWLQYYPELEALDSCNQDPQWHPEGNVWTHTLHCLNAFAKHRTGNEWEDLVVGLAVLCHDLGKPSTTIIKDGRIRSPGHAKAGVEVARNFIGRLTDHKQLTDEVLPLVQDHMTPLEFHHNGAGDSAIRRLAQRVKRIDRLVRVSTADKGGRPPLPWKVPIPEGQWLLQRAEKLAVKDSAPKPLLLGRHLLGMGYEEGPDLGKLLASAYEAQIDGGFETLDEGIEWVRENY